MRPIYLDYNATTPLLPEADAAMRTAPVGNPSSAHHAGRTARRALEDARERVAALLGAQPDEVTFTSGATEANNLAIFGRAGGVSPLMVPRSGGSRPPLANPVRLLGPAECPVFRLNNFYRFHFQIQSENSAVLHEVLRTVLAVAKPPGAPGRAEARVVLAGGKATVIERFACSAGGASVRGRAALAEDGNALGSLDAAAAVAARDALHPPGHVTLVLRSASAGHEFVLTSDDAGSLFRALGQGADATGGRLAYAGIVDLAGPGMPFDGRLELHDFTLLRSPTLARVATLASLSGITSLLEERGVRFERLDAGIASHGSTVTITDALARGPSVNLLVSGTIDRAELTSSLHGTLVPSYYGINTAAGRVPLLGSLIAGNERQGVQAFDFDVSGPLASPRVSVHPLSSLAPGALRDLARRVPGKHRYHGRR